MILWLLTGCVTLDFAVHNGVHCSNVDEATCGREDAWDSLCLTCDEPYAYDVEYPYFDRTLEDGQEVRAIPPDDVENVRLTTDDGLGELDILVIDGHGGPDGAYANTTVIFNHGNYGGLEHYMVRIRYLYEAGFDVIAWDYRGYGKSEPSTYPTPEQFMADARQVRDWADDVVDDADRIVVYANSIGTSPAVEMAVHAAPCALILEVPFPGFADVGWGATGVRMPEGFVSGGELGSTHKMPDYTAPLFVMVGGADPLFPASVVEPMYEAAGSSVKRWWELPGVGHGIGQGGGIPEESLNDYLDQVGAFLAEDAAACITP